MSQAETPGSPTSTVKTAPSREADVLTLRHPDPLEAHWATVGQALHYWAHQAPNSIFLAERNQQGKWDTMNYVEAETATSALARKLIALGCSPLKPLAIISSNSIQHALLALAAQRVGIPVAPISLAYATVATDFSRLHFMLELIEPGAIYLGDPAACSAAAAAVTDVAPLLADAAFGAFGLIPLDGLDFAAEELMVDIEAAVTPDTVAKLMFTSGSTGKPKAVINTHRMLCANQAMLRQVWPILKERPPVMVDWLPWSHTFGANFTFNMALFNGGSLYIDAGKPVPALIGKTLQNLAEVQPTIYFNVPAGYDAMRATLRDDRELARKIFARMEFAFCAAAALPQSVRDELQAIATAATGQPLPFYAGWGSTETAPCATATWWETERSDSIGLPLPDVELRFVPDGNKLELRVRGPIVTPGYWRNEEATRDAFDHDGFYKMGDAGKCIDPAAPELGVLFDGRVSENFKLTSGTWVSVGSLRLAVVDEGQSLILDVVVTGSGRSEIGLLVFVNGARCKELVGGDAERLDLARLTQHPVVIEAVRTSIKRYNGNGRGSSSRVERFVILPDSPRIEVYEITDKGYINQRAVLDNRATVVEELYANDSNRVN